MRLIDADPLYAQAADTAENYCGFFNEMEKVISARDIEQAPTIDAVQVVRCRDCKYSDTLAPDCTEATFPLKCLSIRYGGVYPDWFCEHGERKERQ